MKAELQRHVYLMGPVLLGIGILLLIAFCSCTTGLDIDSTGIINLGPDPKPQHSAEALEKCDHWGFPEYYACLERERQ